MSGKHMTVIDPNADVVWRRTPSTYMEKCDVPLCRLRAVQLIEHMGRVRGQFCAEHIGPWGDDLFKRLCEYAIAAPDRDREEGR